MNSQRSYLNYYNSLQPVILLKEKINYKAIVFNGELYDFKKIYNHRVILRNEVVIEYDDDNKALNRKYADIITSKMKKDGVGYSKWFSGNKSVHIHCLLDVKTCRNISLLKKCFVRYYTEGLPLPDLQLLQDSHNIRCEYGLHEKTGVVKTKISEYNYFNLSEIPKIIWERYKEEESKVISRQITKDLKSILSESTRGINFILSTQDFREVKDYHTRALFILIPVLRAKYSEDELVKYLQDWYHYTSGVKMNDVQIEKYVRYYYKKSYGDNFYQEYLNTLLEQIGRNDLVVTQKDLKSSTISIIQETNNL